MLGHGESFGYDMQDHSRDVAAVLDTEGIEAAVLVGNSLGGMIAMQFALDYLQRLVGLLVLSSGTGLGVGGAPAFERDFEGTFEAIVDSGTSVRTRRERPEIQKRHEGAVPAGELSASRRGRWVRHGTEAVPQEGERVVATSKPVLSSSFPSRSG
jgi:pimeloyl-ACP methyl ester carboxylesterase